jgi:hypothetical protein
MLSQPSTLAPLSLVAEEKEPVMSQGTFLPVFPIPASFFPADERPCYHVPSPRPSWLRRLWQHLSTPASTASRTVAVTPQEQGSARYPCDIYG